MPGPKGGVIASPPCKGGAGGGSAEGGRNSGSAGSLASLAYPPLAPPFQGGDQVFDGGHQPRSHVLGRSTRIDPPKAARLSLRHLREGLCHSIVEPAAPAPDPVGAQSVANAEPLGDRLGGQFEE